MTYRRNTNLRVQLGSATPGGGSGSGQRRARAPAAINTRCCDLQWNEVARVMLGDEAPSDGDVAREAARLRKRFQLLKDDLKLRAKDAGLIDGEP
jgi:hypothetical protein